MAFFDMYTPQNMYTKMYTIICQFMSIYGVLDDVTNYGFWGGMLVNGGVWHSMAYLRVEPFSPPPADVS